MVRSFAKQDAFDGILMYRWVTEMRPRHLDIVPPAAALSVSGQAPRALASPA